MLIIKDLDKLKITSITAGGSVIHFKYDDVDYFIHTNDEYFKLYKGRHKNKENEFIASHFATYKPIKYINNRRVLNGINKKFFVKQLVRQNLVETTIEEIKEELEEEEKEIKRIRKNVDELKMRLRELEE